MTISNLLAGSQTQQHKTNRRVSQPLSLLSQCLHSCTCKRDTAIVYPVSCCFVIHQWYKQWTITHTKPCKVTLSIGHFNVVARHRQINYLKDQTGRVAVHTHTRVYIITCGTIPEGLPLISISRMIKIIPTHWNKTPDSNTHPMLSEDIWDNPIDINTYQNKRVIKTLIIRSFSTVYTMKAATQGLQQQERRGRRLGEERCIEFA